MPRKSRIDAPGALHHIIARGIERSPIFRNNQDRADFIRRLSAILKETGTHCYAWTLIANHFHLLLKTGLVPVAQVMRRLLTGYAVSFNKRHHRSGYLFQNRYKSILCQEDSYLLELVRYIHLNPLRAGLVGTIEALDLFAYCGHSAIMGNRKNDWQDTKTVLLLFSSDRSQYRCFIEEGVDLGKRSDLTGGGLIRSSGGWANVLEMKRQKVFQKSDERILGDGDFVLSVLANAEEQMERKYRMKAQGIDLDAAAERVCQAMKIAKQEIYMPGKERRRVHARSLFCYFAAREAGVSQAELCRLLKLSPTAVTFSVKRGEELARKEGYSLL
jgi:REP element-mobilizing transposase RayT